jgi:hypothetical protein
MQLQVNYTNIGGSNQHFSLLQEVVDQQIPIIKDLSVLPPSNIVDLFIKLQQHNEQEFILSFSVDFLAETFYIVVKGGAIENMALKLFQRLQQFFLKFNRDQH